MCYNIAYIAYSDEPDLRTRSISILNDYTKTE